MASADLVSYTNPLGGILTSLLGGEEDTDISKTTTGTSTQTTNADLTSLKDVYAKQAAGITPEMLTAIFSEGSKKIPTLTNAYANAVGARAGNNSPLGLSIHDLQGQLTNDAARLNMQMLADSGKTAAQIADLTKTLTNTNTSTDNTSVDTTKTVDKDMLKLLGGLGIGASGLDALLGGNGVTGGLNDIIGMITGTKKGIGTGNLPIGDWLSRLLSGEATGGDIGTLPGLDDIDLSTIDLGGMDNLFSGGDVFGDIFSEFNWTDLGFADGGYVKPGRSFVPRMADGGSPDQQGQQRQLLQMLILKKIASTPEGKAKLGEYLKSRSTATAQPQSYNDFVTQAYAKGSAPSYGKTIGGVREAFGSAFGSPDRKNEYGDAYMRFEKAMMGGITGYGPEGPSSGNPGSEGFMPGLPGAPIYGNMKGDPNTWMQDWLATLSPSQRAERSQVYDASYAKRQSTARGGMAAALAAMGAIPAIQAATAAAGAGGGLGSIANAYSGASGLASKVPGMVFKGATTASDLANYLSQSQGAPISSIRSASPTASYWNQMPMDTSTGAADGGEIENEGIEDDIPILASKGEYVIPADVVKRKGTEFFDKLIEQNHTPAALQKAMGA